MSAGSSGPPVAGVARLRTWLHRVVERLGRRTRLHAAAGAATAAWVRRNIDAQGGLVEGTAGSGGSGGRWPPLARSTLVARRRAGLGSLPLVATGRLRAGTRVRAARARAVVDNPVPYAARHQLGDGVPARPFFPAPAQAARIVDPVVQAFVREALR